MTSVLSFPLDISTCPRMILIHLWEQLCIRRDAQPHPIVHESLVLQCLELEREMAIRNARDNAVIDERNKGAVDRLSSSVAALGDIMLEMQRRRIISEPNMNDRSRAMLRDKALTDEQIGELASDAFEAGAMELAKHGYPGAAVFSCSAADIEEGAR